MPDDRYVDAYFELKDEHPKVAHRIKEAKKIKFSKLSFDRLKQRKINKLEQQYHDKSEEAYSTYNALMNGEDVSKKLDRLFDELSKIGAKLVYEDTILKERMEYKKKSKATPIKFNIDALTNKIRAVRARWALADKESKKAVESINDTKARFVKEYNDKFAEEQKSSPSVEETPKKPTTEPSIQPVDLTDMLGETRAPEVKEPAISENKPVILPSDLTSMLGEKKAPKTNKSSETEMDDYDNKNLEAAINEKLNGLKQQKDNNIEPQVTDNSNDTKNNEDYPEYVATMEKARVYMDAVFSELIERAKNPKGDLIDNTQVLINRIQEMTKDYENCSNEILFQVTSNLETKLNEETLQEEKEPLEVTEEKTDINDVFKSFDDLEKELDDKIAELDKKSDKPQPDPELFKPLDDIVEGLNAKLEKLNGKSSNTGTPTIVETPVIEQVPQKNVTDPSSPDFDPYLAGLMAGQRFREEHGLNSGSTSGKEDLQQLKERLVDVINNPPEVTLPENVEPAQVSFHR